MALLPGDACFAARLGLKRRPPDSHVCKSGTFPIVDRLCRSFDISGDLMARLVRTVVNLKFCFFVCALPVHHHRCHEGDTWENEFHCFHPSCFPSRIVKEHRADQNVLEVNQSSINFNKAKDQKPV